MAFKDTVKEWFKTGFKPTQAQFYSKFDFLRWKDEKIPIGDIEEIEGLLNEKADAEALTNHVGDAAAHAALFAAKADAQALLNHIQATFEGIGIEAQSRVYGDESLQFQIDDTNDFVSQARSDIAAINTLLTSNDINLDTVQEVVDAIKTVQTSLSTILVNDLTTGGTTKALTAEMGKTLKGLIDGLTTNKVDKVAGERLINAAEITKLAGVTNVTTTVKIITSASLATQDVAGFVAYINALAVVLVVGANEIVEYQLSDTGRLFKLLLRGRSFGTGQAAITTADVEDCSLWMQKDIKLSNYPSTRNDGQLPTNKVLAPDVNGNLKLYTIATAPAPYLSELIPDSYLPSTTGNFKLKGAFFTPTMTISIVGQTINYITFISDNEVNVNATTGSAEGFFAVTLNNGISATFPNALLIVLGDVYKPEVGDWTTLTGTPAFSTGYMGITTKDQAISAEIINPALMFRTDIDSELRATYILSPLESSPSFNWHNVQRIELINSANQIAFYIEISYGGPSYFTFYFYDTSAHDIAYSLVGEIIKLRCKRISGVPSILVYVNDVLKYTSTVTPDQNYKIRVKAKELDWDDIKIIHLAI